MTNRGLAAVIQAMAGAQKLLVPKWLYEAILANMNEGPRSGGAEGIDALHYAGGSLPLEMGKFLPDDLMVILERNGGMKGVKLEREPPVSEQKKLEKKEDTSVSSTFHTARTRE